MTHVTTGRARIPALGFGTFRMSEAEVAEVLPAALAKDFTMSTPRRSMKTKLRSEKPLSDHALLAMKSS